MMKTVLSKHRVQSPEVPPGPAQDPVRSTLILVSTEILVHAVPHWLPISNNEDDDEVCHGCKIYEAVYVFGKFMTLYTF